MRETTISIYLFTLAYLRNSTMSSMVLVNNNSDMSAVCNIGSEDGLLSHNACAI
jgi:hypothetical protein